MKVRNRLFNFFGVLLVVATIGGCATVPDEGFAKSSAARLQERAEVYWEARRLSDTHTWFEMESAGRPGGWMSPVMAARMGRDIRFEEISVGKVAIDGDRATVEVTAQVRYLAMAQVAHPFRQVVEDRWVFLDGEWYHYTPEWKPVSTLVNESRERRQKEGASATQHEMPDEAVPAEPLQ